MSWTLRAEVSLEAFPCPEVNLDPDLLDVLVHPFVGDLGRTADNDAETTDPGKLFEELVHLLENSVGHWRSGEKGIQFDLAQDQVVFERLLVEASQSHLERREDLQRFFIGFMDYQM